MCQAGLNGQVVEVQEDFTLVHSTNEGQITRFECFLTADGKGMQAMNFQEGKRCWTCDLPFDRLADLTPVGTVTTHVRYGAFLPTIPPARRVGDYVHAACRILNAIFKRLTLWAACLPSSARNDLSTFIKTQGCFSLSILLI